jgi:hypothetical protein
MIRSSYLFIAVASLAGAMFFASAGSRPHQIYAETWRGQIEAASSPSSPLR